MAEPGAGDRALIAARAWLGTPYRHGASVRGEASDCLGLVRGVWRELYGAEPQPVPAYRPDWAETGGPETLLDAAGRWFAPRPLAAARPGDVVLFRMAPGACVKHCALLSAAPGGGDGRVIHAYWGRAVVESWLGPWWRSRLHSAWAWPIDPPPCGDPGGRDALTTTGARAWPR